MSTYTASSEQVSLRLPHGVLRGLRASARQWGVSLNKAVLLALQGQHVIQVKPQSHMNAFLSDPASRSMPAIPTCSPLYAGDGRQDPVARRRVMQANERAKATLDGPTLSDAPPRR